MLKTLAELNADREKAYRVLEVARWLNEPLDKMMIYHGRLEACQDAIAAATRGPRASTPEARVIFK